MENNALIKIHTQDHHLIKNKRKSGYFLAAFTFFIAAAAQADGKPLIVAELFTSHYCPSCPPADEILKSLAVQDNIIPLACHVSYQNGAGRIDPYTQDFCDLRQYGYVGRTGSKKIFTPQMFINGGAGFIGSHREELNEAMQEAYENSIETIPLSIQNDTISFTTIKLPQSPDLSYNLWAFGYKKSDGTPVTSVYNIGKWDGATITRAIAKPREGADSLAVIIQEKNYGRIVAAGKIDLR